MNVVDQLRAKQLGEAMLAEFEQYPRDTWLIVTMQVRRRSDGGIEVDNINSVREENHAKQAHRGQS